MFLEWGATPGACSRSRGTGTTVLLTRCSPAHIFSVHGPQVQVGSVGDRNMQARRCSNRSSAGRQCGSTAGFTTLSPRATIVTSASSHPPHSSIADSGQTRPVVELEHGSAAGTPKTGNTASSGGSCSSSRSARKDIAKDAQSFDGNDSAGGGVTKEEGGSSSGNKQDVPGSGSNSLPSRPRLVVAERLQQLQQARAESRAAMLSLPQSRQPPLAGSFSAVEPEHYRRVVASRDRMVERLNEANAYISHLESRLEQASEDVEAAAVFLTKLAREFGSTARLGEASAAAIRFGMDRADASEKALRVGERLRTLEQVVHEQRRNLTGRTVRRVPVAWTGLANQVRLMGAFDNWTRGFDLSASGRGGADGGCQTFEAVVPLLPGEHLVKFLVDGKWRTASGWPSRVTDSGDTNNVIIVL